MYGDGGLFKWFSGRGSVEGLETRRKVMLWQVYHIYNMFKNWDYMTSSIMYCSIQSVFSFREPDISYPLTNLSQHTSCGRSS